MEFFLDPDSRLVATIPVPTHAPVAAPSNGSPTPRYGFLEASLHRATARELFEEAREGGGSWRVMIVSAHHTPLVVMAYTATGKPCPSKLRRVHGYVRRERGLLDDVTRTIAEARSNEPTPYVVDVGANHGLFSLLAAHHGAHVTAVEAQWHLARLVDAAALANGVGDSVRVFHNAALDVPRVVQIPELALSLVNEGGTARLGDTSRGVAMTDVATVSIDLAAQFEWPGHDPHAEVAFLKVDVEGNELPALRSAMGLFERRSVRRSAVEFGPAADWQRAARSGVAGSSPEAAYDILRKLRTFGYTVSVDALRVCDGANPQLDAKLQGAAQSELLIEREPRNFKKCA